MAWTAPRTWVSGETVTAALLNVHLRDNLKALGDPWTPYTPSWTAATTNPTLNNGSKSGTFIQVGKLVMFRINITFGSTTTVGNGIYSFGLPVAAIHDKVPLGQITTWDNSLTTFDFFTAFMGNGVTDVCRGRAEGGNNITNAVPIAWATSDEINIQGMYEAA